MLGRDFQVSAQSSFQEMGATTLISRDVVAARILAGEHLIIHHDHLLKIPISWLEAHPGGALALLHFVGRDATDEIEAYHLDATQKLISRYSVGRVDVKESGWEPLVPPIMSGWVRKQTAVGGKAEWFNEATAVYSTTNTELAPSSQILLVAREEVSQPGPELSTLEPPPTDLSPKLQLQHSRAYRELHKRIVSAGLYKTPYLTGYGPEVLRYLLFGSLSAYAYSHNWLITSAVLLGLLWHQLAFAAHDLGHMGVTHNWAIDRIMAIFIANFMGGLSIGWWVDVSF